MVRRSSLRASDEDRERAAERLRQATGEGRLMTDELEDRLSSVFAARTYGELDLLVRDIPAQSPRRRHSAPTWLRLGLALAMVLGVAAAVAVAVALLAALAALWMTWVLVGWTVLGRRRCVWGGRAVRFMGRSGAGAIPLGRAGGARRVPGGGRVSF